MGWGEVEVKADAPLPCSRCGKPADVMVVTQRTVTVISLRGEGQSTPQVTGTADAVAQCKTCAAPKVFANSPEVMDVLEGRSESATLRIDTRRP